MAEYLKLSDDMKPNDVSELRACSLWKQRGKLVLDLGTWRESTQDGVEFSASCVAD